jgi:membrane protein DedA with SNARE-associated domain
VLDYLVGAVSAGGFSLIGLSAVIENTVIVNAFWPGAVPILFGMAATHGSPGKALAVFTVITAASLIGQHLTYALGRHRLGLQWLNQPDAKPASIAPVLVFLSYWHPNFGAAYTYLSAVRGDTYRQFLFRYLLCGGAWNVFWGVAMYNLGRVPIGGETLLWPLVGYLVGMYAVATYKASQERLEARRSE